LKQPEYRCPVDVVGELRLESAGGVGIRLAAQGQTIALRVESFGELLAIWRRLPNRAGHRRLADLGLRASRVADTTLLLKIRGRTLARLSGATRGTWLSRLLGAAPVNVRLRDVLLCLFSAQR
jgi:hypothetical protein